MRVAPVWAQGGVYVAHSIRHVVSLYSVPPVSCHGAPLWLQQWGKACVVQIWSMFGQSRHLGSLAPTRLMEPWVQVPDTCWDGVPRICAAGCLPDHLQLEPRVSIGKSETMGRSGSHGCSGRESSSLPVTYKSSASDGTWLDLVEGKALEWSFMAFSCSFPMVFQQKNLFSHCLWLIENS